MTGLVEWKGWRVAVVVCQHCQVVSERPYHVGAAPPEYCNRSCAAAAKHRRRATGTQHAPNVAAPHQPCPGCGHVRRLGRRGTFAVCTKCRARIHGACMRKTPFATDTAAAAFRAEHGHDQEPYRCSLCELWHLTSPDTADELDGDVELGRALRAAGFKREAVR